MSSAALVAADSWGYQGLQGGRCWRLHSQDFSQIQWELNLGFHSHISNKGTARHFWDIKPLVCMPVLLTFHFANHNHNHTSPNQVSINHNHKHNHTWLKKYHHNHNHNHTLLFGLTTTATTTTHFLKKDDLTTTTQETKKSTA